MLEVSLTNSYLTLHTDDGEKCGDKRNIPFVDSANIYTDGCFLTLLWRHGLKRKGPDNVSFIEKPVHQPLKWRECRIS